MEGLVNIGGRAWKRGNICMHVQMFRVKYIHKTY